MSRIAPRPDEYNYRLAAIPSRKKNTNATVESDSDGSSDNDLPGGWGVAAAYNDTNKPISNRDLYPFPHLQAEFNQWEAENPGKKMPGMDGNLSMIPDEGGVVRHPLLPLRELIAAAINGSPRRRLTVREIKAALMRRFAFFAHGPSSGGWHSSIRWTLNHSPRFKHIPRKKTYDDRGKWWTLTSNEPPDLFKFSGNCRIGPPEATTVSERKDAKRNSKKGIWNGTVISFDNTTDANIATASSSNVSSSMSTNHPAFIPTKASLPPVSQSYVPTTLSRNRLAPVRSFDGELPLPSLRNIGLLAYGKSAPPQPRPVPPLVVPQTRIDFKTDSTRIICTADSSMKSVPSFVPVYHMNYDRPAPSQLKIISDQSCDTNNDHYSGGYPYSNTLS